MAIPGKPGQCPAVPFTVSLDNKQADVEGTEAGTSRLQIHVEGDFHPDTYPNSQPIDISDLDPMFSSDPPYTTYADKHGHFIVTILAPPGRGVRFKTKYCKISACYDLILRDKPEVMTFTSCPDQAEPVLPVRPYYPVRSPRGITNDY